MKINADEIKNKDVKSMNKEQLDEFSKEVDTFSTKTKFIRNAGLLKIIYYVLGYTFGLGTGFCLATVLMTYIFRGVLNIKFIIISCILLVVCITLEVTYRTTKHRGEKYSAIITNKLNEISLQNAVLDMKKDFEKSENMQTPQATEQTTIQAPTQATEQVSSQTNDDQTNN